MCAAPLNDTWSQLPGLTTLNLSNNDFYSTIPAGWGQEFEHLVSLDLSNNNITGPISEGEPVIPAALQPSFLCGTGWQACACPCSELASLCILHLV